MYTSLMIDESRLICASVDEEALLNKLYPSFGNEKLAGWRKQRYVCEKRIEWNQYVADLKDGHLVIEIPRAGHD